VIADFDGERVTPKEKAQQLLMDSMMTAVIRLHEGYESDAMTPREQALVVEHLEKQKQRVERLFGYDLGSWRFQ
jgi:hypothetical protein